MRGRTGEPARRSGRSIGRRRRGGLGSWPPARLRWRTVPDTGCPLGGPDKRWFSANCCLMAGAVDQDYFFHYRFPPRLGCDLRHLLFPSIVPYCPVEVQIRFVGSELSESLPARQKRFHFPLIFPCLSHIIKVGKSLLSIFQKGGVKSCQQMRL